MPNVTMYSVYIVCTQIIHCFILYRECQFALENLIKVSHPVSVGGITKGVEFQLYVYLCKRSVTFAVECTSNATCVEHLIMLV